MVSLILIFLTLAAQKNHRQGWSHFAQPGWTECFFMAEDQNACLAINGFDTGLRGAGKLYIESQGNLFTSNACKIFIR